MLNDLIITEIVNVYYLRHKYWKRDFFAPRQFDAVVFFIEGEIEYFFENKRLVAKKGDLLYLPGNIPYSGLRHTDDTSFFVLDFKCLNKEDFNNFGAPCVVETENYNVVFLKFSEVVEHWKKQNSSSNLLVKSFLYYLVSIINEAKNDTSEKTDIGKIISYINDNIADAELSVNKLCKMFYVSEAGLRRNFHRFTGLSPNEYIMTVRLNKAKKELLNANKNIKEISFECGFASQYYFSKCFFKNAGMSPSKYRKLTAL